MCLPVFGNLNTILIKIDTTSKDGRRRLLMTTFDGLFELPSASDPWVCGSTLTWSLDLFPDILYCNLHDFEQHFNVHGPFCLVFCNSSRTWTSFYWLYDFAQDTIVLDLTMQFPFCPWLCQALWRLVCTFFHVFLLTFCSFPTVCWSVMFLSKTRVF